MDLEMQCFPSCLKQSCWNLIKTWRLILFYFPIVTQNSEALGPGTNALAVCIGLPNTTHPMCILLLTEVILPHI
jgi:hypothetical protein